MGKCLGIVYDYRDDVVIYQIAAQINRSSFSWGSCGSVVGFTFVLGNLCEPWVLFLGLLVGCL